MTEAAFAAMMRLKELYEICDASMGAGHTVGLVFDLYLVAADDDGFLFRRAFDV